MCILTRIACSPEIWVHFNAQWCGPSKFKPSKIWFGASAQHVTIFEYIQNQSPFWLIMGGIGPVAKKTLSNATESSQTCALYHKIISLLINLTNLWLSVDCLSYVVCQKRCRHCNRLKISRKRFINRKKLSSTRVRVNRAHANLVGGSGNI